MTARIKGGTPRKVVFLQDKNGSLFSNGIDLSLFIDNILDVASYIEAGEIIPEKYYRASMGRDELYDETGIIHLRIAKEVDNNVRLFIKEYPDRVIFICLNTHKVFNEKPVDKSFKGLYSKIDKSAIEPLISPETEPPKTDESFMRHLINIISERRSF